MTNTRFLWCGVGLLSLGCLSACTGSDSGGAGKSGSGGTSAGTGGTGGSSSGNGGSGGGSGKGGKGGSAGGQTGPTPLPTASGEPDPNPPPGSVLAGLPGLPHVKANVLGDNVQITFDPLDDARDYRVYALPANDDITTEDDGSLTIQNAVYRCAGNRQTPPPTLDDDERIPGDAINTRVEDVDVEGYTRSLDEATLGYVYTDPGDGLVPVYALGHPGANSDSTCYFARWKESRVKEYVASEAKHDELVADRYRDDGIVFYVPADGAAGTRQVFTSTIANGTRFYFTDGPEVEKRSGAEPAFSVLAEPADGTQPLMRVFYSNTCGASHDELAVGKAKFERARRQGDQLPAWDLHWAGFTGETTLVIEALADLCPVPPNDAIIAAQTGPSMPNEYAPESPYPPLITPEDAQAASPSGELYINGHGDAGNRPRPFARSFLTVEPTKAPELDWFAGFDDSLGDYTEENCAHPSGNCYHEWRQKFSDLDVQFFYVEDARYAIKPMLGELWVNYADLASDVNGKFRMTPDTMAEMNDDSYLYVTMQVNALSTGRRYPQIFISDQLPPVQHNLTNGNTVLIQTFGDWPSVYQLEVCDHRTWDVNDQCPKTDLYHDLDPSDPTQYTGLAPNMEVGDVVSPDRSARLEAYVSTQRAYLFLDGQPYGCVDLPAAGVPKGPVTVTFGDVLYHSGADQLDWFGYYAEHYHFDTVRHYDNLGFKSGALAPKWDESLLPCTDHFFTD